MGGRDDSPPTVASLLLAWQATQDERRLEQLLDSIATLVESSVRKTLRCRGIADPSAVDEATALVFDHIRRLPGRLGEERGVQEFRPVSDSGRKGHERVSRDAGVAFVRWLATERACDVARSRRRQARKVAVFSQLPGDLLAAIAVEIGDAGGSFSEELRHAVAALDPRSRNVIECLLDGESQSAIARRIGVCEGTVSRIRANAIQRMRSAFITRPDEHRGRRSPK